MEKTKKTKDPQKKSEFVQYKSSCRNDQEEELTSHPAV